MKDAEFVHFKDQENDSHAKRIMWKHHNHRPVKVCGYRDRQSNGRKCVLCGLSGFECSKQHRSRSMTQRLSSLAKWCQKRHRFHLLTDYEGVFFLAYPPSTTTLVWGTITHPLQGICQLRAGLQEPLCKCLTNGVYLSGVSWYIATNQPQSCDHLNMRRVGKKKENKKEKGKERRVNG